MDNVTDMTKRRQAQLKQEADEKKAEQVGRMFSWLGFLKRKNTDVANPHEVQEAREEFNEHHPYERGSKDDPWMNN